MRAWLRRAVLCLCFGVATHVSAQGYIPGAPGVPSPSSPGGSAGGNDLLGNRLRFHAGAFEFSPYIHVGEVAVDTNVFYTATERRTDLIASGGPGLTVACPIGDFRPWIDGNLNYYWYQKTVELRHLGGQAGAGFDWMAGAFSLGYSGYYIRSYTRPSIEVDRRVLNENWANRVYLGFNIGPRLRLEPHFEKSNNNVLEPTQYLGTDLQRTLTQDMTRAQLDVRFPLTTKTDFVIVADQQWDRFPQDPTRDADSNRFAGGFDVTSTTRLAGRAIGGVRLFRPKSVLGGENFTKPYANVNVNWLLGTKTRLSVYYTLDINYSAFQTVGRALPTASTQIGGVHLFRRIWRKIEMDMDGQLSTLKHNVPVVIQNADGTTRVSRDDQFYTAHFDLGYRVFEHLRIGGMVTYNERQSNYADFGVNGLLFGASIRFNP